MARWIDDWLNIHPQEKPSGGWERSSAEAEGLLFNTLLFFVDEDIQAVLVKVTGDIKSKGLPLNTFDDRIII